MRTDLLKLVYANLLYDFRREQVVALLRSLTSNQTELLTLLKALWDEGSCLPFAAQSRLLQGVEAWLQAQGCNLDDYAESCADRFATQPVRSSREVLLLLKPWMNLFYSTHDQRQLLLKLLGEFPSQSRHLLVGQTIRYGWRKDVVLFSLPGETQDFAYGRWILPIMKRIPRLFGLPDFEEVRLIADPRSPQQLGLPKSSLLPCQFSEFLTAKGLELGSLAPVDCEGWVQEGREGCFFGAPLHLAEFRYKSAQGRKLNPFEGLISSLIETEQSLWKNLQERHELLLEEANDAIEIVYHGSDDSISLDNKHLMRSVPAKILRNVLREYSANGRQDFEFREFKRDNEICLDALNPNFEGRLNRVIQRLQRFDGVLELVKHRRGAFYFKASRPIRYREE